LPLPLVDSVAAAELDRDRRVAARVISPQHHRNLAQQRGVAVDGGGADKMVRQVQPLPAFPEFAQVQEIRLPVPGQRFVAALPVEGHRDTDARVRRARQ
jgi:hypothetical protein